MQSLRKSRLAHRLTRDHRTDTVARPPTADNCPLAPWTRRIVRDPLDRRGTQRPTVDAFTLRANFCRLETRTIRLRVLFAQLNPVVIAAKIAAAHQAHSPHVPGAGSIISFDVTIGTSGRRTSCTLHYFPGNCTFALSSLVLHGNPAFFQPFTERRPSAERSPSKPSYWFQTLVNPMLASAPTLRSKTAS